MGYLFLIATLVFTVYGQIVLKWRLNVVHFKVPKSNFFDIVLSFVKLFFDPFILSGFIAAFIASLFWMATMTKFEITQAYPFMSLAPVIVFILGVLFLNETFTMGKVIGLIFIIIGTIITVKF